MWETDTFLTELYIMIDDFCKTPPLERHRCGEIITTPQFVQ